MRMPWRGLCASWMNRQAGIRSAQGASFNDARDNLLGRNLNQGNSGGFTVLPLPNLASPNGPLNCRPETNQGRFEVQPDRVVSLERWTCRISLLTVPTCLCSSGEDSSPSMSPAWLTVRFAKRKTRRRASALRVLGLLLV